MLTIYGVYRSRALRNYWMAEELGLPVKSVPIIQARKVADPLAAGAPLNTRSPEFRSINPLGFIPAIEDDGLVLAESLAINLYLARKHGGPLAPRDIAEEGLMQQWTLWAATEIEPHAVRIVLTHDAGAQDTNAGRQALANASEALKPGFAILDAHLQATGFVVGDRFTAADLNVAEVFRYAMGQPQLFEAAPAVKAWLERCHARPAFEAVMARRLQEAA